MKKKTTSSAQDIFQEALIVLVGKVKEPNFTLTATLSTYLFVISKNIWLKYLRDNKFINTEQFDRNRHDVEIYIDENETIHQENKLLKWNGRINTQLRIKNISASNN